MEAKVCLFVGNGFIVLSTRLKRHDYTISFHLDWNTFVMARPSLNSDWLAVFRPLSVHMWAGVMGVLLLVSVVLWGVSWGVEGGELGCWGGKGVVVCCVVLLVL